VLSEDGNTANHLLSWSRETGAQAIARNLIVLEKSALGGNVYSEMTGPSFSPNGQLLFGNVQEPGHVCAIRGPWRTYWADAASRGPIGAATPPPGGPLFCPPPRHGAAARLLLPPSSATAA
jgi:secreted PhoX family phosphatase